MFKILLNAIPVILMIWLIPHVSNDLVLTAIYLAIIIAALAIKRDKKDIVFLLFGLAASLVFEWFFISRGVEIFQRNSLFGLMPLWLPVLWGYVFVAIRRVIVVLDNS